MAENGERRDSSSHRTPGQITRAVKGYGARPENRKKRAKSNAARKKLGLKVGDPRDAHHVKPQRSGGSNDRSNLKAVHRSKNRAWEAEGKPKMKPSRKTKKYLHPGMRRKQSR